MLDIDKLQLGKNCLLSVTLLVISGMHHIIPAQEFSMPYGTCVYTMKTDGQWHGHNYIEFSLHESGPSGPFYYIKLFT